MKDDRAFVTALSTDLLVNISMNKSLVKLIAIAAAGAVLAGCNPTLRTHGYIATEEEKPQAVETGTDTKASVLARLGNPSVKGTFDEELDSDTWYYMSAVRQRFAYLRPIIEDRTITAISFDQDGQVTKVAEYGLEDSQYVNYVDRKTPTRGRQLSILEQIFGTLGRLPTDRIGGQQDVPGGAGGPGGR